MLPAAIVLALSPTGILEMIVVLFSARARINAIVFLTSVVVSVFVLPLLGASVLRAWAKGGARATSPNAITAWVLIGLGVVLVLLAIGSFRKGARTTPPAVFNKITGMSAGAVFVLSLTVMLFNPINAVVLLSVGAQAASTHVSTAALLPSLVVFTLLATLPFIAVVVYLVWGGEEATAILGRIKQRLVSHYRIVTAVALGLVGLLLVAQGIIPLLG